MDKKLPAYNIETIMEMSESSSLIDLKTLAVLLRIFEMVYEQIYYLEDVDLKTPLEKVNFTLNTKLLVYRMQHLLEIKERRNELSEFQLQNLEILSTHLKEIVLRESCKMESNPGLSEEVLEILSKTSLVEFKDPPVCYFCKQNILFYFVIRTTCKYETEIVIFIFCNKDFSNGLRRKKESSTALINYR